MLAMAGVVTAFPLVLVGVSFLIDEGTEDRMRDRVWVASGDVIDLFERDGVIDPRALDAVAQEHGLRIRVIRPGATLEANHDGSSLAGLFFGDDGAPSLREYDETLGPVEQRPEAEAVSELAGVGCRTAPGGRLSVCHSARRVRVGDGSALIYTQESSRRSIRALFDLRYQLLKLTLVVLPLSLLLAWWLGRRFVRPIEQLREQVREHGSGRRSAITLDRGDELGELASAFDHLVEKLDDKARANEAFLADVAHELKSPVATVRLCAETLEDQTLDPKRAARLARALSDSARRMESLLGRLLELARAEAGMPDATREPVAFGELVQEVVDEVSLRHPEVSIHVSVDRPEATLVGVPDALAGVMRNLIDNAAAFGDVVRASVETTGDTLQVTVEDDGPGIDAEDLPRVFERFFTTRSRAEGTGLGLAFVRAVVEAHGGQVDVASRPGEGARFTVLLPA